MDAPAPSPGLGHRDVARSSAFDHAAHLGPLSAFLATLLACSSPTRPKERPSTSADAAISVDAPEQDAAPARADWKFSQIYPLLLRDCPLTLPLVRYDATSPAGRRWITSMGPSCTVPLSANGTYRNIDIELAEQSADGSWHQYRLKGENDTGGSVHSIVVFLGQPGSKLPKECDRIGADVAAYGRALMGLSSSEAARIAGTFQHLIATQFDGFLARVPIRDGFVHLIAGVTIDKDKAYCAAGFDNGLPYPDEAASRIVDVPLASGPAGSL